MTELVAAVWHMTALRKAWSAVCPPAEARWNAICEVQMKYHSLSRSLFPSVSLLAEHPVRLREFRQRRSFDEDGQFLPDTSWRTG